MCSIVEALIGRRYHGWGVRELAEHLSASRSTVNRLLSRLVEERMASRDISGAYVIGPPLRILSNTIQENHPLLVAGGRIPSHLSATTGATAVLAVESPKPEECFVLVSKDHPRRCATPRRWEQRYPRMQEHWAWQSLPPRNSRSIRALENVHSGVGWASNSSRRALRTRHSLLSFSRSFHHLHIALV
ncbi:helix-turn-helix domain-containing protein [Arthrobacter cheniae]|uniref:helix-turn-helix domain-containing protein n=1 Tax=Arthrobacter cheniae TaxID=1258888 RepID=UPI002E261480